MGWGMEGRGGLMLEGKPNAGAECRNESFEAMERKENPTRTDI